MSDLNEWLNERRTIRAGGGDDMGVNSPKSVRAIVDAHNTLPAALTAIEKVLEVISKIDREHSKAPGDDAYADGMCDAAYMFDTALSEAIEGAIK